MKTKSFKEFRFDYARVAQLVEHDLAKVGVAGSNPVSRSMKTPPAARGFLLGPGGGIGRRAGLKILWPALAVRVQVPPGALLFYFIESTNTRRLSAEWWPDDQSSREELLSSIFEPLMFSIYW